MDGSGQIEGEGGAICGHVASITSPWRRLAEGKEKQVVDEEVLERVGRWQLAP